MRILTLLLVAFLTIPSLATNDFAGFLTVKVEGVPHDTSSVFVALDGETELELRPAANGVWRGSYLLLPQFYRGLPTPVITLKDKRGNILPATGLKHHIASSTMPASSLPLALSAENVAVVVDARVAGDSVRLITREGRAVKPNFSQDSFTLPEGLDPKTVVGVSAVGTHGQEFVFEAPFDQDVATP